MLKSSILPIIFLLLFYSSTIIYSKEANHNTALSYYIQEFQSFQKPELRDTLFEKIIWHRKVSHIILEERDQSYYVTLLISPPFPHNYKAQNYPIHYIFQQLDEAQKKIKWINKALLANTIWRVTLNGSYIIQEKILYKSSDLN